MFLQIKGGPLLQKQLVHNATISSIVPRWQTFEAWQFDLQVQLSSQGLHATSIALDPYQEYSAGKRHCFVHHVALTALMPNVMSMQ